MVTILFGLGFVIGAVLVFYLVGLAITGPGYAAESIFFGGAACVAISLFILMCYMIGSIIMN